MESKTATDPLDRIGELERQVQTLGLRLEASLRHARRFRLIAAFSIVVLVFVSGAALVESQFTRLQILGPNNDVRVDMNVNPIDSGTSINLLNTQGVRVLLIGVDPKGSPEIVFFDETGRRAVKAVRR
jgi:hypothetical protein